MSIIITGDSTIDLSPELKEQYGVQTVPLYVNMGDRSCRDGVDMQPDDIYAYVAATGQLPKTSAPSIQDYIDFFTAMRKDYDEVVHFSLSSELSVSHQNARLAAEEVGGVSVIDSRNLSTGTGLLVLEACDRAMAGMDAKGICREIEELIPKVEASFILNRLDYLAKGGRCSSLLALGANVLKLRPVIMVQDGKMDVGKKYRGAYDKCVEKYVEGQLAGRSDIRGNRIFVTHTKCRPETIAAAKAKVAELQQFDEILETTAGGTITNHCGEETLGVLFIRK